MGFLIDHSGSVPASARGAVVAIGNFDGVHLGHQMLLRTTVACARERGCPAVMMTFEPHPRQFFQPQGEPFRLTFLAVKARIAKSIGIDHVLAFAFDAAMAGMRAEEFIAHILKDKMNASAIVVGADFHFGKDRQGGVPLLQKHFDVLCPEPVRCTDGQILSSTRVRAHVKRGEMAAAKTLLGHDWDIEEAVIAGEQRGRVLGFPTANQAYLDYVRLPFGVYATQVLIAGENKWRPAVSNFGLRPMFALQAPLMETHILGYAGDLYGKTLRLRPVRFLRPEMAFDGLPALKDQMKRDCQQAAAVLESAA